jgi:hypothetical protein
MQAVHQGSHMTTNDRIASSIFKAAENRQFDISLGCSTRGGILRALQEFNPISLAELRHYALLDRIDTKYLMREDQLASVLASINGDYRVLEIDGACLNHYRTVYFETEDFSMYREHHAGALNRFKVRSREYLISQDAFFEIKMKDNKRRMVKNRIPTDQLLTTIDQRANGIVDSCTPYESDALRPVLQNTFTRITFASVHACERFTMDLDLRFYAHTGSAALRGLAIAEVKQEHFSLHSPVIQQMRRLGLRPDGFSKYCMGINMLYPAIKRNNFKSRRLLINKLLRGN